MKNRYIIVTFFLIFIYLTFSYISVSKGKRISEKYHSWLYKLLPTASDRQFTLSGKYYEASILTKNTDPKKTAFYHDFRADYRLWIPGNIKKIRGLIVKQHGCGEGAATTGLNNANDLQWQVLSKKHEFALLGTKYTNGDRPCEEWALMNNGSKDVFLKALTILAEKSTHSELEKVPWVLWGHSGGADWVAQMFQEFSSRTIAMVGVRGGGFEFYGINPLLAKTPVLFMLGEKDPYASETIQFPKQVFAKYRKINAPAAIAIEPDAAHETGSSRFLIIPYLDSIISLRLDAAKDSLKSIDIMTGWLGNTVTHAIAPAAKYKDDPQKAAWLPNEEVARKWQEYVSKGKILPTRRPVAPTEVRALKQYKKGVIVTWNYAPDLEVGLPLFHVYRNNSLVARFDGQIHNFNDAPEPVNFALQFKDEKGQFDSIYKVTAVNALGETASKETQVVEVN